MAFTGNEDQHISLDKAAELTRNYRQSAETGAILGGYGSKYSVSRILDQPGCVGLRIYYAMEDNGNHQFVIVGVNANGDDLYDGEIMEHIITCPPICPKANPLTS
jgi:hypothetical protein